MKFALQSNHNGKFLSHLFVDDHESMFQASKPDDHAYHYDIEAVAESIAAKEGATVIPTEDTWK